MKDSTLPSSGDAATAPAQRHAALFTGMVLQQANLALMCLGKAPRPDTKETTVDLEAATLFIDTLEMLEARTRGNLGVEEAEMLRETLTSLRIAFVEAADRVGSPGPPTPGNGARTTPSTTPPVAEPPPPEGADRALDEAEARKKFVKRY